MGWAERAEAGLRSHSRRRPSWPGGRECSVRQLSLRPLGPSAASVPVSGEEVKLRGRLGVCSWSPGASHPLRGGSGRRSFLALRGHWRWRLKKPPGRMKRHRCHSSILCSPIGKGSDVSIHCTVSTCPLCLQREGQSETGEFLLKVIQTTEWEMLQWASAHVSGRVSAGRSFQSP